MVKGTDGEFRREMRPDHTYPTPSPQLSTSIHVPTSLRRLTRVQQRIRLGQQRKALQRRLSEELESRTAILQLDDAEYYDFSEDTRPSSAATVQKFLARPDDSEISTADDFGTATGNLNFQPNKFASCDKNISVHHVSDVPRIMCQVYETTPGPSQSTQSSLQSKLPKRIVTPSVPQELTLSSPSGQRSEYQFLGVTKPCDGGTFGLATRKKLSTLQVSPLPQCTEISVDSKGDEGEAFKIPLPPRLGSQKPKLVIRLSLWMANPHIRALRFWDVTLPGSHNSASWCLVNDGKKRWGSVALSFLKLYIHCQDATIYHQLQMGVRFLDLRVCKYLSRKGEPYCAHGGFRTVPLKDVLRQIASFCESHPSEVIVLSVRRDVAFLHGPSSLGILESDFLVALILRSFLGPQLTRDVTIGELADRHQNVLYFFEERERYLPSVKNYPPPLAAHYFLLNSDQGLSDSFSDSSHTSSEPSVEERRNVEDEDNVMCRPTLKDKQHEEVAVRDGFLTRKDTEAKRVEGAAFLWPNTSTSEEQREVEEEALDYSKRFFPNRVVAHDLDGESHTAVLDTEGSGIPYTTFSMLPRMTTTQSAPVLSCRDDKSSVLNEHFGMMQLSPTFHRVSPNHWVHKLEHSLESGNRGLTFVSGDATSRHELNLLGDLHQPWSRRRLRERCHSHSIVEQGDRLKLRFQRRSQSLFPLPSQLSFPSGGPTLSSRLSCKGICGPPVPLSLRRWRLGRDDRHHRFYRDSYTLTPSGSRSSFTRPPDEPFHVSSRRASSWPRDSGGREQLLASTSTVYRCPVCLMELSSPLCHNCWDTHNIARNMSSCEYQRHRLHERRTPYIPKLLLDRVKGISLSSGVLSEPCSSTLPQNILAAQDYFASRHDAMASTTLDSAHSAPSVSISDQTMESQSPDDTTQRIRFLSLLPPPNSARSLAGNIPAVASAQSLVEARLDAVSPRTSTERSFLQAIEGRSSREVCVTSPETTPPSDNEGSLVTLDGLKRYPTIKSSRTPCFDQQYRRGRHGYDERLPKISTRRTDRQSRRASFQTRLAPRESQTSVPPIVTPFVAGRSRIVKSWSVTCDPKPTMLCKKLVCWSFSHGYSRPRKPYILKILAGEVTPPSFGSLETSMEVIRFWTVQGAAALCFRNGGLKSAACDTHRVLLAEVLTRSVTSRVNGITHDFVNEAVVSKIVKLNVVAALKISQKQSASLSVFRDGTER